MTIGGGEGGKFVIFDHILSICPNLKTKKYLIIIFNLRWRNVILLLIFTVVNLINVAQSVSLSSLGNCAKLCVAMVTFLTSGAGDFTSVLLVLKYDLNEIVTVENGTFLQSKSSLYLLDLGSNHLTSVPSAAIRVLQNLSVKFTFKFKLAVNPSCVGYDV